MCNLMSNERANTRRHLKHSAKVQEEIYDSSCTVSLAGRMSNIVKKIMLGEDLVQNDLNAADVYIHGVDVEDVRRRVQGKGKQVKYILNMCFW